MELAGQLKIITSGTRIASGTKRVNSAPHQRTLLSMKHAVIAIVLLVFAATSLVGQNANEQPRAALFHWDYKQAQELFSQQSVSKSKDLSPQERAALTSAIAAQLRPHMTDLEIGSERELREVAAATRIKLIDLDGDGIPEIMAQEIGLKAGCGATGNCPFWIFQRSKSGYSVLLHRQAQTFTIQPTKTNGFHDLVLGLHTSATEAELTEYRFDGVAYRRAACYDANWTYLGKDGEYHDLKEPRITTCGKE